MQLAGDPQPLLVHPAFRGRGPLGALAGPLLPAYADQLGDGEHREHPGGDAHFLRPGRRAVPGGREPPVQPVPDEQVPGPEQADGSPSGPAPPGDDGGEAGQGEAEEHGAVRIAAGHIDQGDHADPIGDGRRIPVPHHEQGGPDEQQAQGGPSARSGRGRPTRRRPVRRPRRAARSARPGPARPAPPIAATGDPGARAARPYRHAMPPPPSPASPRRSVFGVLPT